jgi:hypothetical protein
LLQAFFEKLNTWLTPAAPNQNSNNSKYQFWQQHNHPLVLSNIITFEQRLNYIHDNPVLAGFVDNPVHYPYSSAIDYADGKGYVNIVLAR